MGLLEFLIGKSKVEKKLDKHTEQVKKSFRRVKKDIKTINTKVEEFEKVVAKDKLEKIVENIVSRVLVSEKEIVDKPQSKALDRTVTPKPGYSELTLSPAQKRIISVLAQHNDMVMSYKDIAAVLNLSPTTVKNTMNQIKKGIPDMFREKIDDGGSKRYHLNEGLKFKTMIRSGSEKGES